jgi:hypothetical protein
VETVLVEVKNLLRLFSYFITPVEMDYFKARTRLKNITESSIIKFGLFPDYYARFYLKDMFSKLTNDCYRTWVLRGFGGGLNGRAHINDQRIMRYINGTITVPWSQFISDDVYLIRSKPISDYGKFSPTNLVIAEGLYDIVPLYLNRLKYGLDEDKTVYMGALCSAYGKCEKVFTLIYNRRPDRIYVFADKGISIRMLRDQFGGKLRGQEITINWPKVKDWEDVGPVDISTSL